MSDELSRKLGYAFQDSHLFKMALTHRSKDDENNERLEFLGDSIVNFVIAEILFQKFPFANEGELSRWRATLINRDTLGALGKQFDVGRYLHLGVGELKSGGSARLSIVSCAMEALIGAIYLDSNFETVRERILAWYTPLLSSLTHASSHKDPKTQLQEYLQKKHFPLPIYEVESVEGAVHEQMFIVRCVVQDKKVIGRGTSRRRAEQEAAQMMLEAIKK